MCFHIVYFIYQIECFISSTIQFCVCCVQYFWQHLVFCHQTKRNETQHDVCVLLALCCFCLCWCTKVTQWNYFNRHILITTIVFGFFLVCKTSYHSLVIFRTKKTHIYFLYNIWMLHGECFHNRWSLEFVHVEGKMLAFVLMECRNLCESQIHISIS